MHAPKLPGPKLPGIDTENYDADINAHKADNQDGAQGFDAKTGGHAINGHTQTSSFDARPDLQKPATADHITDAGLEEQGRARQPNSGIVARNKNTYDASEREPGVDSLFTPFIKPKN